MSLDGDNSSERPIPGGGPVRAEFNADTGDIELDGRLGSGPIKLDGRGVYFCPLEWVTRVEAESMRLALETSVNFFGCEPLGTSDREVLMSLTMCAADAIYFDFENSVVHTIGFGVDRHGALTLEVDVFVEDHTADEEAADRRLEIPSIIEPLLEREAMRIEQTWDDRSLRAPVAPPFVHHLELRPASLEGRTLGDLIDVAERVQALTAAFISTDSVTVLADQLRAGRAGMLLGQPESATFDAKQQPYDHESNDGKVDLALDVARFANATGGVILLGAGTKKDGVSDVVHSFPPQLPVEPRVLQSYRATIDHTVYPLVEGLELETCPGPNGDLIMIVVPPQPPEVKPFIVHGTLRNGKRDGRFFSIPIRRGEESVLLQARDVQSRLRSSGWP